MVERLSLSMHEGEDGLQAGRKANEKQCCALG